MGAGATKSFDDDDDDDDNYTVRNAAKNDDEAGKRSSSSTGDASSSSSVSKSNGSRVSISLPTFAPDSDEDEDDAERDDAKKPANIDVTTAKDDGANELRTGASAVGDVDETDGAAQGPNVVSSVTATFQSLPGDAKLVEDAGDSLAASSTKYDDKLDASIDLSVFDSVDDKNEQHHSITDSSELKSEADSATMLSPNAKTESNLIE